MATNEVMSHPGLSDAALIQKNDWGYQWDAEAAALQAPAIRQAIEARGIVLSHFGEI